jgi:hypothetical protein
MLAAPLLRFHALRLVNPILETVRIIALFRRGTNDLIAGIMQARCRNSTQIW